jgi:hypothetical protein
MSVVFSEKTNAAPHQKQDDIEVVLDKKAAHLEKLIENFKL